MFSDLIQLTNETSPAAKVDIGSNSYIVYIT